MAHRPATVGGPSLAPLLEGAPPGVVIGAAISVLTTFIAGGLSTWLLTRADHLGDWSRTFLHGGRGLTLFASGMTVQVLYLAGLVDLTRRSERSRQLRPAVAAVAVMLAIIAFDLCVQIAAPEPDGWIDWWPAWRARGLCVAALVASGSLVAAGWSVARLRVLAGPLLLVTALAFPWAGLADLLEFASRGDSSGLMWFQWLVRLTIAAGYAGGLLLFTAELGRVAPPRATDWPRAGSGLYRAGSALVAGIVATLLALGLVIVVYATDDLDLGRTTEWAGPLAVLLARIALIVALLQAGGRLADDAARLLLHGAAAAVLWSGVANAIQDASRFAAHYYQPGVSANHVGEAFPNLIPLVAVASLLVVLSAVAALRRWLPGAVEASTLSTAAGMVVVLSATAVALERWSPAVRDDGKWLLNAIGVAMAVVIAHLAVARVCHRMGAAMRDRPGLPSAVARDPD